MNKPKVVKSTRPARGLSRRTIQLISENKTDKHLLDAARLLVMTFKTPGTFLEFLTESIDWTVSQRSLNQDTPEISLSNDCFFISQFIKEVVQPWIVGGKSVSSEIAAGLEAIFNFYSTEEYKKRISIWMVAFGASMAESGVYEKKYYDQYLSGMNALFQVAFYFDVYDNESLQSGR